LTASLLAQSWEDPHSQLAVCYARMLASWLYKHCLLIDLMVACLIIIRITYYKVEYIIHVIFSWILQKKVSL
jgi:hypothetical protein